MLRRVALVLMVVALAGCAVQRSRPDLINEAMASANFYCPQVPLQKREACATAAFNHYYPSWRHDINADLIQNALDALGEITSAEAAGTITADQANERFNDYVSRMIAIGNDRDAAVSAQQAREAAFAQTMSQVGAALLQASRPDVASCTSVTSPNGRVTTTNCGP